MPGRMMRAGGTGADLGGADACVVRVESVALGLGDSMRPVRKARVTRVPRRVFCVPESIGECEFLSGQSSAVIVGELCTDGFGNGEPDELDVLFGQAVHLLEHRGDLSVASSHGSNKTKSEERSVFVCVG